MAWRPNEYLIEGELDNTQLGRVTGWIKFLGMKEIATFELKGDFHRDIRGTSISFTGTPSGSAEYATKDMEGFATHHTGDVGDITAGLPPTDYVKYPYLEIYSDTNGRIVLELNPSQITVKGTPIPFEESDPISRVEQDALMDEFMSSCAGTLNMRRPRQTT